MCTDVHLSIESKSIIRGKNFNHPTLNNIHSKSLYYQIIINNNNNNNPTESKMKLQTNASNGIMGMDFILVIYLVITVSFAFRTAVPFTSKLTTRLVVPLLTWKRDSQTLSG